MLESGYDYRFSYYAKRANLATCGVTLKYDSNMGNTGTSASSEFTPPKRAGSEAGDNFVSDIITGDGNQYYLKAVVTTGNSSDVKLRIDGFKVERMPNAPLTTKVQFASATSSIAEDGGTIDVCVGITNEDATNATTVEVALNGGTATSGTDFTHSLTETLTFPAATTAAQCVTLTITDDALAEGNETIDLVLQNAAGGNNVAIGTPSSHTVTITDNDIPTTSDVRINELDCDTPTNDNAEFIELFGTPNYDLTGLVLVLFNGNGDVSYKSWDLDGYTLDANGYFIIGNSINPQISYQFYITSKMLLHLYTFLLYLFHIQFFL